MNSNTSDTNTTATVTSPRDKAFAAVLEHLDAHDWEMPEWVEGMATDTPRNDADELLNTDLWPIPSHGREHLDGLRGLCHSEGCEGLFAEGLPRLVFSNPRLGFIAASARRGDGVGGGRRYVCQLTDQAFVLPTGAPVPVLFVDAYEAGEPFNADQLHPADRNPWRFVVHPAIVEVGAAFVLWAGWLKVRDLVFGTMRGRSPGEVLRDAVELLTLLVGTGPEDVGVESPVTAFRAWQRGDGGTYEPTRIGWEPAK